MDHVDNDEVALDLCADSLTHYFNGGYSLYCHVSIVLIKFYLCAMSRNNNNNNSKAFCKTYISSFVTSRKHIDIQLIIVIGIHQITHDVPMKSLGQVFCNGLYMLIREKNKCSPKYCIFVSTGP